MPPEEKWVRVEFHCHTAVSIDSSNRIDRLLKTARECGLDRLCITDHNTIQPALKAQAMDPQLVVVGEEIRTTEGELLAYFVTQEVQPDQSPQHTIEQLKKQNAFISVAHPFDRRRHHWSEESLRIIRPNLDGIEIFNSRCFNPLANAKAANFALENSLPGLVGSDAHSLVELGLASMRLPIFCSADELRQVLFQAEITAQPFTPLKHFLANASIFFAKVMPCNWGNIY